MPLYSFIPCRCDNRLADCSCDPTAPSAIPVEFHQQPWTFLSSPIGDIGSLRRRIASEVCEKLVSLLEQRLGRLEAFNERGKPIDLARFARSDRFTASTMLGPMQDGLDKAVFQDSLLRAFGAVTSGAWATALEVAADGDVHRSDDRVREALSDVFAVSAVALQGLSRQWIYLQMLRLALPAFPREDQQHVGDLISAAENILRAQPLELPRRVRLEEKPVTFDPLANDAAFQEAITDEIAHLREDRLSDAREHVLHFLSGSAPLYPNSFGQWSSSEFIFPYDFFALLNRLLASQGASRLIIGKVIGKQIYAISPEITPAQMVSKPSMSASRAAPLPIEERASKFRTQRIPSIVITAER